MLISKHNNSNIIRLWFHHSYSSSQIQIFHRSIKLNIMNSSAYLSFCSFCMDVTHSSPQCSSIVLFCGWKFNCSCAWVQIVCPVKIHKDRSKRGKIAFRFLESYIHEIFMRIVLNNSILETYVIKIMILWTYKWKLWIMF